MSTKADRDEIERFLMTPLSDHLESLHSPDQAAWDRTLIDYAGRTPAYVDYLKEANAVPADLPERQAAPTTKPNYINRYPLHARCLDGDLRQADFMAVSSGTTGKATIWPRSQADEIRTCFALEQIFVESFDVGNRRTLALVCFPLGIWIGGMYTASAARILAAKGHAVTVLTPGTNMGEIRRCLAEVAPLFDQTVLCGYPPFLRDVVDELLPSEIDAQSTRLRLLLAGEAISEEWRDDLGAKLMMDDVCRDCISMYGTADAGIIGFETAETIMVRRLISGKPDRCRSAFGNPGLPSIFQYQPYRLRVEEDADLVLITAPGVHPLFRYSLGDAGTGMSFDALRSRIGGIDENLQPQLPVAVLFGRTDHTVSFFGGNIYPEHIAAFMDRSEYRIAITGRFTMLVKHSSQGNRPLTVVVELQPQVEASDDLSNRLAEALEAHLLAVNSEYANYVPSRYQRPDIVLRRHRDDEFFARGKKQAYIRKE